MRKTLARRIEPVDFFPPLQTSHVLDFHHGLLGLTLASPREIREIKGISDKGIPIVIRRLKLQIGSKLFPARVAWCLLEEVPLLLGRMDCFRLFEISFRQDRTTVFQW